MIKMMLRELVESKLIEQRTCQITNSSNYKLVELRTRRTNKFVKLQLFELRTYRILT